VRVRGGSYYLSSTLDFGPGDSGSSPTASIIYEAYPGEKPIISAGQPISGFSNAGGRWKKVIPDADISHISVNGVRREKTSLPKNPVNSPRFFRFSGPGNKTQFTFNPGELNPAWLSGAGLEIQHIENWFSQVFQIASISGNTATIVGRGIHNLDNGNRYYVKNAYEGLAAGEWHINKATKELTYMPMPGEHLSSTTVVVPRLERVVYVNGASYLTFNGLTFADSNWRLPSNGHSSWQGEMTPDVKEAILVENARGVILKDCEVKNTGAFAIFLSQGTKDSLVESCNIHDLGAGGIKVGGPEEFDDSVTVGNNRIFNNEIHKSGRILPGASGIWIGFANNIVVENNDIHDHYYSGVSVGWAWSDHLTPTYENLIQYNHIWDCGKKVMNDLAGVYTLGRQRGTFVRGNRIHDIEHYIGPNNSYGGWGIYFDQGSAEITAELNIIYRTTEDNFMTHPTQDGNRYKTTSNTPNENRNDLKIINNILAFGGTVLNPNKAYEYNILNGGSGIPGGFRRNPEEGGGYFTMTNNIIYQNNRPMTTGDWAGHNFWWAGGANLFYDVSGNLVMRGGYPNNNDIGGGYPREGSSIYGQDPLFVDPANDNFTLRSDSPAYRLAGFRAFPPMSQMGRTGSTYTPPTTGGSSGATPRSSWGQEIQSPP